MSENPDNASATPIESISETSSGDKMRIIVTVTSGIVGMLLFVAGAVLAIWSHAVGGFELKDWKLWLGYGSLFVSIGTFVWLLQWNRDLERVSPAIRRTLYGYNIFLVTIFLAAILVIGNLIVVQYGHLFGLKPSYDWTSQGVFTLSDVSIQQVKSLTKPVKVIALFRRGSGMGVQLEQLLNLYKQASKNFDYEFLDPVEKRIDAEDLFKKYPEAAIREPTLIVEYGTGDLPAHKVIKQSDLLKGTIELDPFGPGGSETEFHGENRITSAIRELIEDKKVSAYFTTGHREKDLNSSDRRDADGIGLLKQQLTNLGIKAETIDLIKSEVPSDANLLAIVGPKSAFQASEIQKIRDFMDRKGSDNTRSSRLLVMLDSPPEMGRGAALDAGLGELLAGYKVQVKNNLVYDRVAFQRIDQIVVTLEGDASAHQIVSTLKGGRALLVRAREIAPMADTPPGMPGEMPGRFQVSKLFSSSPSPSSWAQGDFEERPNPSGPDSTPGPICVGVAVAEGGSPPPRMPFGHPPTPSKSTPVAVVFGDATLASNLVLGAFEGAFENESLVLNTVNWLGGRVSDLGIQPKTRKGKSLSLDNAQYYTIIFEPFFHLLAIAGFLAGLVWVVRADRYQLLWLPIGGTVLLVALWAGLAMILVGSPTSSAYRVTVMRVLMTCLILWAIGLSFWFARMRPAPKAETA